MIFEFFKGKLGEKHYVTLNFVHIIGNFLGNIKFLSFEILGLGRGG